MQLSAVTAAAAATFPSSITLPEKPADLEFTNAEALEFIVTTYEKTNDDSQLPAYSGSVYKLHGNRIVRQIRMPGGIFRFTRQTIATGDGVDGGHIITALTTGSIGVIDNDLNGIEIIPVTGEGAGTPPLLSVSLHENFVLCSDAAGQLYIVDLVSGNIVSSFLGHLLPYTKEPCEIWTTALLNTNCALSGAEDNLLKIWDLRSNIKQPVGTNKVHQGGVICLQREKGNSEHSIISGSYDDHIRRIDIRNFTQSVLEKKMNGGVWSVQDVDGNSSYVISCMYGGWALVQKTNFDIVHANEKIGENLLYSADFSPQTGIIVSCTFNNYSINFEAV